MLLSIMGLLWKLSLFVPTTTNTTNKYSTYYQAGSKLAAKNIASPSSIVLVLAKAFTLASGTLFIGTIPSVLASPINLNFLLLLCSVCLMLSSEATLRHLQYFLSFHLTSRSRPRPTTNWVWPHSSLIIISLLPNVEKSCLEIVCGLLRGHRN